MSVLFTFPGQGAQCRDMLHALPDHPEVVRTLDEAGDVLGYDPLGLDSEDALGSTVAAQLSLLLAGVATARVLAAQGHTPDIVAGLSIGAYPAAVVADALDFADAVSLVALRGRLMANAYDIGYGMTAIMGLSQRRLERLIAKVNVPEVPVFLANINSATQMVIAGSDDAMQIVSALACGDGATRCERVNISVPSHCPLLDGVSSELAQAFRNIRVRAPRLPYLSSSLARSLFDSVRIAEDLAWNAARQVRWCDTVQLAWERGARLAVEMPSGNVLTKLTADTFCDGLAVSIAETRLDSIHALMDREQHRGSSDPLMRDS
jgi:malonate decarboxylase epsilon subunit